MARHMADRIWSVNSI